MSVSEDKALSSMDLWRLSDTLSVVDAAILIIGGNPGEKNVEYDGNEEFEYIAWTKAIDYPAAFKALRNAILSNRLAADLKFSMRGAQNDTFFDGETYEIPQQNGEERISYDLLLSRPVSSAEGPEQPAGTTRLNFSVEDIAHEKFLYICREPNWEQTLIDVEDLKEWLSSRGIYPSFFFPESKPEGFRDKSHPRYSAKLATAVAAWENIDAPERNSSVKQTLTNWIQSNGVKYGVGDGKGIVSTTAAEEIAKIANWHTKGGANPTQASEYQPARKQREPIENYPFSVPKGMKRPYPEGDDIPS